MTALPFTPASEEDVATAILTAATDKTDRMRFLVGPDAVMQAHMRWEASEEADEEAYNDWTIARFSPAPLLLE